jgi:hypothetical protein
MRLWRIFRTQSLSEDIFEIDQGPERFEIRAFCRSSRRRRTTLSVIEGTPRRSVNLQICSTGRCSVLLTLEGFSPAVVGPLPARDDDKCRESLVALPLVASDDGIAAEGFNAIAVALRASGSG